MMEKKEVTDKEMRWGIIGTGRITDRFLEELHTVEGMQAVCIYNRRLGSVKQFLNSHTQYQLVGTDQIEKLLQMVDAVYIAVPHALHYEYAKQMLEAGKHVLCEKPFVLSGEQARELYEIANARKLVLMEAIKTAYCPGFRGILQLIEQGKIGTVHDVEACFSKLTPTNTREIWGDDGGSFFELGSYSLLPVVKLLGRDNEKPFVWSYQGLTGVDSYTKYVIPYKNGIGTAKNGLGVKSEGELIIAGTKGYIRVPSPWWLTKHVEVRFEDASHIECYDYPFEGAGLRYELQTFKARVEEKSELAFKMQDGLTEEESIWLAKQMEHFRTLQEENAEANTRRNKWKKKEYIRPQIWAHRGCSMRYPENTLSAFEAAANINGIKGIELDVQLSKDGELVVIHDETLDRTTTGSGNVCDYTLAQLKQLRITGSGNDVVYEKDGKTESIPTLEEVLELLKPYCVDGLLINIELKNSRIRYEGMEEKVYTIIKQYNLQKNIIYSSFLPESMGIMKNLDPKNQTGILGMNLDKCLEERTLYKADAVHPWIGGLNINPEVLDSLQKEASIPVRAWNGEEPFYGQERPLKERHLEKYSALGVTDIITNVPELYLEK